MSIRLDRLAWSEMGARGSNVKRSQMHKAQKNEFHKHPKKHAQKRTRNTSRWSEGSAVVSPFPEGLPASGAEASPARPGQKDPCAPARAAGPRCGGAARSGPWSPRSAWVIPRRSPAALASPKIADGFRFYLRPTVWRHCSRYPRCDVSPQKSRVHSVSAQALHKTALNSASNPLRPRLQSMGRCEASPHAPRAGKIPARAVAERLRWPLGVPGATLGTHRERDAAGPRTRREESPPAGGEGSNIDQGVG